MLRFQHIMEEDLLKVLTIKTSEKMNYFHLDLIDEKINSMKDVELIRWHPDYFKITYYQYEYDQEELLSEFQALGIRLRKQKKESWIYKLLSSIAKENKKSFGDQSLDCCDLNKVRKH